MNRFLAGLASTLAGLLLVTAASSAEAQAPGARGCNLCHGELELLRQRVPDLEQARALLVPSSVILASAHDTMTCASCHSGFSRHPHPETGVSTEACVSCHEEQESAWSESVHATDSEADCADCHTLHEVAPVDALHEAPGRIRMNRACVTCHDQSALPRSDPHADSVLCASCHSAHETEEAAAPGSWVAPDRQPGTCGACHEEAADHATRDVHGKALAEVGLNSLAAVRHEGADAPPTCTSCHGSHGMLAPAHEHFNQDMVDQCADCHAGYAETYFGTYHGKATAVGSEIVATCDQCHGAHDILPASNPASMVAEDNLVETCGDCHEEARPAFVLYDSHPDPMDRSRNPPLFYSFVFMNFLLFSVLGVFALHTALWWVRLMIDKRKGVEHGIGGHHG